jgi:hypothetical protein
MKPLLVTFGDSWTYGSELDTPNSQNWTHHLGKQLDAATLNLSCPASSIGHLTVQLFQFIEQAEQYKDCKKIFAVGLTGTTRYLTYSNRLNEFINITPEACYRSTDIHTSGRPPETANEFASLAGELYRMAECSTYNKFLLEQAVMLFQNYCQLNDIDCIFFSYFDYLQLSLADTGVIYKESITKTLTGSEYAVPAIRDNVYFSGKLFHPNEHGHIQIAAILKDFYDQCYSRN